MTKFKTFCCYIAFMVNKYVRIKTLCHVNLFTFCRAVVEYLSGIFGVQKKIKDMNIYLERNQMTKPLHVRNKKKKPAPESLSPPSSSSELMGLLFGLHCTQKL